MNEIILLNKSKKNVSYSSKIIEKKRNYRALSAENINNCNKINIYKKYDILPTLKTKNSFIKIQRNILNNSMTKNNNFKYEIEKLYDQNVNYKKKIKKLQYEINLIKNNLEENQNVLNTMNEEIEKILKDNKEELETNIFTKKISSAEKGRYAMISKMKNKIKEAENGLIKEIFTNKKYKKSLKFTKINELELEKRIIEEQKQKIIIFIENSKELEKKQKKDLEENKSYRYNKKLISQQKEMIDYSNRIQNLEERGKDIENQIIKYKNNVDKINNNVKRIRIKHISLKEKNDKLKKEQIKFNKKNDCVDLDANLQKLNKQLSTAKNEYNYQKRRGEYILQKLDTIKKIDKNKNKDDYNNINNNSHNSKNSQRSKENDDLNDDNKSEKINKLKIIYEQNRKKENELEENLILYKEAIEKKNNGENINIEEIKNKIIDLINQEIDIDEKDENETNINEKEDKNEKKNLDNSNINNDLILSYDNPYYTDSEENEIIKSKKFNRWQFTQFTYVLFKNFEAKKINYEKAQKNIIIPLMNFYQTIINEDKKTIQKKLNEKFCEIIRNILNINNENDLINLKVYFNSIYYEKVKNNNSIDYDDKYKLLNEYFLSLFNYINEYDITKEKKLKNKLITKYKNDLTKLKHILENIGKDKRNKENINKANLNDYISFQEIKNIFDSNNNITIKEKYIEFIIYYMKQYNDNNSSLYDLKKSKLEDILKEEEIIDKDKDNKIIEINAEISLDEYNKNINSVLVVIKQLMEKEKKDIKILFGDSIIKNSEQNKDIITIESFSNELNKRDITLNQLQISCFNKKYCINEETNTLDFRQIENDVIKFK